jgi:hypothetical protein
MREGEPMKTHEVRVTRDGRWWMIEIPELDGLTQARRLDEVESMAREYIAVTLDVPLSTVAVSVSDIEVDGQDLLASKAIVAALREQARELEEAVAAVSRALATVLTDAKVPLRDIGQMLGVSHQRVSQIVGSSTKGVTVDLARAIHNARAKSNADLVIRLGPGHARQIVHITTQPANTTAIVSQDVALAVGPAQPPAAPGTARNAARKSAKDTGTQGATRASAKRRSAATTKAR